MSTNRISKYLKKTPKRVTFYSPPPTYTLPRKTHNEQKNYDYEWDAITWSLALGEMYPQGCVPKHMLNPPLNPKPKVIIKKINKIEIPKKPVIEKRVEKKIVSILKKPPVKKVSFFASCRDSFFKMASYSFRVISQILTGTTGVNAMHVRASPKIKPQKIEWDFFKSLENNAKCALYQRANLTPSPQAKKLFIARLPT